MPIDTRLRGTAFAGALVLSAVAQLCFRAGSYGGGLIASALSAAAIGLSLRGVSDERSATIARDLSTSRRLQGPYVALAMLAIVLILQHFDRAYALQVALWLSAIVLFNAAYRNPASTAPIANREKAAVAAILFAGFVLRAYDLEFYPTGLHGDEGSFGLWAVRIVDGERIPPFALGWDFHATLFHYAQAAAMTIAGKTVAGDRLAPAVLGALTMLPFYMFIQRALGARVALASVGMLALLPWHLYFSRLAVDDVGVALCTVGAMAALYQVGCGAPTAALAAGTWLGLSFYCGHKAVMLPVMMAAGVVALHVTARIDVRRQWRRFVLMVGIAACVVAPQFAHYARAGWYGALLQHPLSRLAGANDKLPSRNRIALVAQQVERSLLAFQFYPDRSIFLSFTEVPLLPRGVAALYFIGLVLCVCRPRQPLSAFTLAWFAVGLLGSILTMDPPQAHHLVPMIAVPIVLAAIALRELSDVLSKSRWMPGLLGCVVAVVLVDAGHEAWTRYAAPTPWMEVTEIARAIHALEPTHDVVLVTAPMMDSNGTLRFIAGDIARVPKLYTELEQPWEGAADHDVAFIVSWRRYDELPKLRRWYPNGREYKYATAPTADFLTVYEVAKGGLHPSLGG